STQMNLGTAYREKGDFEKAMMHCIEGRNIIEDTDDNLLKAKMDDILQALYNSRTDYKKAIQHGESALKMARKSKDVMFLQQCLVNLGMNYIAIKKYAEAERLLNESLTIAKARGNKRVEAAALMNLAEMALNSRDAVKLKHYTRQSLKLHSEIGSVDGVAVAHRAMGIAFLLEANIDSATWYANKAFVIDKENNLRRETLEILNLLAGISFASGKMKEGFDYAQQFSDTLKLIVNEIVSQQSADLEKKYESEKKQNQISQLQSQSLLQQYSIRQKSTLNYILAGSAVAIMVIALLSYRTYKNRQKFQQQKIDKLETEKQLAATEAVLKGEEQERTRLAKELHDGLGGILSGIKFSFNAMKGNIIMTPENTLAFERSIDMLDSSIKEMRRVAHNMMPEALVKFGLNIALQDFCNDINQSGAIQVNYQSIGVEKLEIEQTKAINIYRIAQELVNNTMKHAAAKTAIVQLTKTNGLLALTVEDDGKGFDTSILGQSKGIGWTNIQNRIDFLQGTMDVRSEKEKGTSVHIEINL
ncbi:MAG: tetratricopeptide repeat-containing sensor histidine kinase, partial [Flavisolibacter sp.]